MQGFFTTVLKLMNVESTSCTLQAVGLETFYKLMGLYSIDSTLPLPPTQSRPEQMSDQVRSGILTTLVSLATAPEYGGLQYLVEAINLVVNQYYTDMSSNQKR